MKKAVQKAIETLESDDSLMRLDKVREVVDTLKGSRSNGSDSPKTPENKGFQAVVDAFEECGQNLHDHFAKIHAKLKEMQPRESEKTPEIHEKTSEAGRG